MADLIPVAMPALGGNEARYVNDCLTTTWISSVGSYIDRFEREFAAFCRASHAISCANGTVALHLALLGLGIGPGDEVLVPSLTYVASANAVRYCGAAVVFVDSDRATWNLDPADVAAKITPRTKAIMAVHLYGRPAPMRELRAVAERHNLYLVEDAAEAHGATYFGEPVGTLADVATFSFYGNKIITCGEGGMVLTNERERAERIRILKGQGQDPQRRYWFPVVGYNYRMTNIQAAIGLAQLEQVEHFIRQRDEIQAWYREELEKEGLIAEGLVELAEDLPHERRVCWLFSAVLPRHAGAARDAVMAALRESGVESRPFFYPCHTLPPYGSESGTDGASSTPVAAALSGSRRGGQAECQNAIWLGERGISLPTWVGLERQQVQVVARGLRRALASVAPAPAAGTRRELTRAQGSR